MHSLKNIASSTGLTVHFIRKCVNEMQAVFKPHIRKGANNKLLFDDSGMVLFQQIAELKGRSYTLPMIKAHMEQVLKPQKKTPPVSPPNNDQTVQGYSNDRSSDVEAVLRETVETLKQQLSVKDKQLEHKEKQLEQLQETVRLLEYHKKDAGRPDKKKRSLPIRLWSAVWDD